MRYLTGGGVESNVASDTLTTLNTANTKFNNTNLNSTTANYIFGSIAATNLLAADGGQAGDTQEELRQNTISNMATQLRAVTPDDYLVRTLSLPSKFGL